MTPSHFRNRQAIDRDRRWFPHAATLVFLGFLTLFAAIAIAWAFEVPPVVRFFAARAAFQNQPPFWATGFVRPHGNPWLLSFWLFLFAQAVMRLSPRPRLWSRFFIVTALLALLARYVLWRSLATLNFSSPLEGAFSIGFYLLEALVIVTYTLQLFLALNDRDRRREADRASEAVAAGTYLPSVDILIPTYSEPAIVLQRTIVGCQAIDYPHKKVYLLDDTRRPEIRQLAAELGCEYITRPDNRHAKAGNLNHGIAHTNGELIACFDADFVPTKEFLLRAVGFFQQSDIGMVQTHQRFYNHDAIAQNLGMEDALTNDQESFGRHHERIRDAADSVVCYGSSFVVRRSHLEEVGGFVTYTLSEDYYTGVSLSARQHRVIYLDEDLSAGLSPEGISAYVAQQQRWARGTTQGFFIPVNPLTVRSLSLHQRLAHAENLLNWLARLSHLSFLLAPTISLLFGVLPVVATPRDWLSFFLPLYTVRLVTTSWLNYRSRSAIASDLYALAQCFPLSATLLQTLVRPFARGFKVTPKGTQRDRFLWNWNLAAPLLVVFAMTAVGFAISLWRAIAGELTGEFLPLLFWGAYNLVAIAIALLAHIDIPQPDPYVWFALRHPISLRCNRGILAGKTARMSEIGVDIELADLEPTDERDTDKALLAVGATVTLELLGEDLQLPGRVEWIEPQTGRACVRFTELDRDRQRRIIEFLFCRPGQWLRRNTVSELQILKRMLQAIACPLVLQSKPKIDRQSKPKIDRQSKPKIDRQGKQKANQQRRRKIDRRCKPKVDWQGKPQVTPLPIAAPSKFAHGEGEKKPTFPNDRSGPTVRQATGQFAILAQIASWERKLWTFKLGGAKRPAAPTELTKSPSSPGREPSIRA